MPKLRTHNIIHSGCRVSNPGYVVYISMKCPFFCSCSLLETGQDLFLLLLLLFIHNQVEKRYSFSSLAVIPAGLPLTFTLHSVREGKKYSTLLCFRDGCRYLAIIVDKQNWSIHGVLLLLHGPLTQDGIQLRNCSLLKLSK